MTDPTLTPVVEVPASAVTDQLFSAVRALLVALSAYVAGKGWVPADLSLAVIPVLMLLGQLTIRKRHRQAVTLAEAAPNGVVK